MKKNTVDKKLKFLQDLERISSLIPAPIYWQDLNGVFLGANEGVAKAVGLAVIGGTVVGKTPYDLFSHEMAHNIVQHNKEVMRTGQILSQEESIEDVATGEMKYFTAIKAPLYDKGKIIGFIGTSIDITDRKKMEEELSQAKKEAEHAKERAEQANQAKSRFLSIMSHEMRGPVGNVISAIDLLKPGHKLSSEEYQKMVYGIEQSGRQALEILKNTSHYLELDSENFERRVCAIYLPDFLRKLEKENQLRVKEGVSFSCAPLKSTVHRLEFDFIHTRQILTIVIDNALKFTQSGSITLSTKLLAPNILRFTLKDTGPGIDEGYLNNIFKTFLNPEILMSEKTYLKTGLKLPLARRIAELADGNLTIESEVGVGTTVYLDMPYEAIDENAGKSYLSEEAIEARAQLSHTTEISFPFSILLVEDDAMNAELELKVLKKLGCHVTWCNTAFKAIDILRKKTFDLIFIDITLPDMTGIALADTIRYSIPETTQMVAVTSHSSDQDHDYFLKHGMMTMLGKPLTEKDFTEFFRGYLRVLNSNDE
jgi:PAS domain S-box-containing protein